MKTFLIAVTSAIALFLWANMASAQETHLARGQNPP